MRAHRLSPPVAALGLEGDEETPLCLVESPWGGEHLVIAATRSEYESALAWEVHLEDRSFWPILALVGLWVSLALGSIPLGLSWQEAVAIGAVGLVACLAGCSACIMAGRRFLRRWVAAHHPESAQDHPHGPRGLYVVPDRQEPIHPTEGFTP